MPLLQVNLPPNTAFYWYFKRTSLLNSLGALVEILLTWKSDHDLKTKSGFVVNVLTFPERKLSPVEHH